MTTTAPTVTEHIDLNYLAAHHATEVVFKEKMTTQQFAMNLFGVTEFVIDQGVHKHLFDTRSIGVVSVENQKKGATFFGSRIAGAIPKGSKFYIATVLGSDTFGNFAVKNMATHISKAYSNFVTATFNTKQEALAWLDQQA